MRITKIERNTIVEQAKRCFGSDSSVMLFGSRTDDNRRGGDIDLLIHGNWDKDEAFRRKINFLVALKARIGDQHIDVVLAEPDDKRSIVIEAERTGEKL